MKKTFAFIMLIGLLAALTLSCFSCKPTKYVQLPNDTIYKYLVEKEIIHDTFYVTKADTSHYRADLVINDSGVVSLSNIKTSSGNYVKSPNVSIKNNVLRIDCEAEAQKLFAQWKEKYIYEQTLKTQTKVLGYTPTDPVEFNNNDRLSYWQETQIWLGRILLMLLVLALAQFLHKKYKPKSY